MDWNDFQQSVMGAIGGIGVMTLFGWPALKSFVDHRLNRSMAELNAKLREVEEKSRENRTKQMVVKKYTRVLLLSAMDLQDRLWHLCGNQFFATNKVLLANQDDAPMYSSWPMTKRHYLNSTLYLFARYFFWVEIIRSRERFLEFEGEGTTRDFDYHLKRVERTLAETSLQKMAANRVSTDKPIFQLMQTEIGQSIRMDHADEEGCLPYSQFRLQCDALLVSNEGLGYLQMLLIQAMSDAKSNFCQTRLRLFCNALLDQQLFLLEQNGLVASDFLEKLPILEFDHTRYLELWPAKYPANGHHAAIGGK